MKDDLPLLEFADAEAFDRWLTANAKARGLWLKFAKKRGGAATLKKAEAIDCALCHGWIDGQLGRLDDDYFLTRFTPRKAGGRWSANNCKRALVLISQGRMRPARSRRDRGREGGRPLASRVPFRHRGKDASGLRRRLGRERQGGHLLRGARRRQPLRADVSAAPREAASPGEPDRRVRRHAGARRDFSRRVESAAASARLVDCE